MTNVTIHKLIMSNMHWCVHTLLGDIFFFSLSLSPLCPSFLAVHCNVVFPPLLFFQQVTRPFLSPSDPPLCVCPGTRQLMTWHSLMTGKWCKWEESDSSESKTGQVTTSAISKSRTSKHSKLRQDSLVWYRHLVEARHTTDCHGLENFSDQRRGNAAWTLWQSMEWSSATWDKCDQKSRWPGQVVW